MAFSKLTSIIVFALVSTVFHGFLVTALTPTMSPSMAPRTAPAPSKSPTTVPAPSIPPTTSLAPGPSPDCFTVLVNVSDCLSYVLKGSNETAPAPPCCGELAGLVESSPICLCQLLSDPAQAGLTIEVSKALNLPAICGVATPPVSTCAIFGYPVEGLEEALAPGIQPTRGSPSPVPPSGGSSIMVERKSISNLLLSLAIAALPMLQP